jgi:hypothetical protein
MPRPPHPQPCEHLRRDGHLAVLAALAIEHAQHTALRIEMRDLQPAQLPEPQPAVVHQRKDFLKTRLLHRREQRAHLLARQHAGQRHGALDLDLRPARPVRAPQVIAEKQAQSAHALVERAALVIALLLEMVEEAQHLLLA